MENGLIFEMDFDENKVKLFSNKIDIDASFIRNVQDGSLIAAGDTITFSNDVTEEIIVEKNLQFFAGNKIKCSNAIKGCVQARSCVGNKIEVNNIMNITIQELYEKYNSAVYKYFCKRLIKMMPKTLHNRPF